MFKAAADKLKYEMEDFGYPPQFPVEEKAEEENKVDKKGKSKKVILNSCHWIDVTFECRAKPCQRQAEKSINGKSCEVSAFKMRRFDVSPIHIIGSNTFPSMSNEISK
jgi:hypothetical protein